MLSNTPLATSSPAPCHITPHPFTAPASTGAGQHLCTHIMLGDTQVTAPAAVVLKCRYWFLALRMASRGSWSWQVANSTWGRGEREGGRRVWYAGKVKWRWEAERGCKTGLTVAEGEQRVKAGCNRLSHGIGATRAGARGANISPARVRFDTLGVKEITNGVRNGPKSAVPCYPTGLLNMGLTTHLHVPGAHTDV